MASLSFARRHGIPTAIVATGSRAFGLPPTGESGDIVPMHLHLEHQKVAVVGAARGLGRAIAEEFVNEGCQVWTFDREAHALDSAQASVAGDVTSFESVRTFAASVGAVDHVVFTVGAGSGKFGFPFWNLDPSDWLRVLEINLLGAVNVAHAFAPKLIERGGGSMLFFVSVAGQIGSQTDPPLQRRKSRAHQLHPMRRERSRPL